MKHTTKEYSELLNGRLPSSTLEFELADKLIDLQNQILIYFEEADEKSILYFKEIINRNKHLLN